MGAMTDGLSRRSFITSVAAGAAGAAALGTVGVAAAAEASADAQAASATGTGTGVARGFGGDVTVTLTVEGGSIVDCAIEGPNETPDRGGHAMEVMQQAYVESGELGVESVAGATVTSSAVTSAASQAYAQATGAAASGAEVHMEPGEYTGSAVGYWGIWELPGHHHG